MTPLPTALPAPPRRPRRTRWPVPDEYLLLVVTLILLAVGLVMVFSASTVTSLVNSGTSYAIFQRQALWVGIGVVVLLVVWQVDYHRWQRLGLPLLLLSIAVLVWVLLHPSGVRVNGASRWIELGGGIRVQPAELAKLALLVFAAGVLARKARLLRRPIHVIVPLLPVTALLVVLLMFQPDLGTALLLCSIALGLLFLAGAPLRFIAFLTTTGLLVGLQLALSAPYRRQRLLSFLDPAADPQGAGYQLLQSQLALGSGGLFGVGLGESRQKWNYLPHAHTDFILAVIGEELGLLGTLTIVVLFALFVLAGIRTAHRAPDMLGRYLAGGVTVWVAVTAVVNMGAVVGLLPITGVPLPMISFGGSSTIVLLAAVGILLNVARQSRLAERARTGAGGPDSSGQDAADDPATGPSRRSPTRRSPTLAADDPVTGPSRRPSGRPGAEAGRRHLRLVVSRPAAATAGPGPGRAGSGDTGSGATGMRAPAADRARRRPPTTATDSGGPNPVGTGVPAAAGGRARRRPSVTTAGSDTRHGGTPRHGGSRTVTPPAASPPGRPRHRPSAPTGHGSAPVRRRPLERRRPTRPPNDTGGP